jgi:hypothetical protein
MTYPGGKNGAGTYQRIINQIPPHRLYVEPFAGSAAILRHKRPAQLSIAIDKAPGAIAALKGVVPPATELRVGCGIDFLERTSLPGDAFVYCDPPYLFCTRRGGPIYDHEMGEQAHRRLLAILKRLPCPVMLSGYWSRLYDRELSGWRRDHFRVITRGGTPVQEWLWMNYPAPVELHDYQYLGENYREREVFRKRRRRWFARLEKMDLLQRRAMLAAIAELAKRDM